MALTKRECAIITAYTGYAMLTGDDLDIFYDYCREILNRDVYTHEFAFEDTWVILHEHSAHDFKKICEEATDG